MVITSVATTVIGDTIAVKIAVKIAGMIAAIDGMTAATIVDLRAGRGSLSQGIRRVRA